MRDKRSPAGYASMNTEELLAISTLEFLLDKSRIKADIRKHDKIPNIDGYLELTDSGQQVIGRLEVQVKKLPKASAKKVKFQTDMAFIAYCKDIAILPVIFVVVDTDNQIAYWEYFSKRKAAEFFRKTDKDSIMVHFNMENAILNGELGYYKQWCEIIDQERLKVTGFEQLNESYSQSQLTVAELSKLVDQSIGSRSKYHVSIHHFLDRYNGQLDHAFKSVKQIVYPGIWKVGMAHMVFEPKEVAYILYTVPDDLNDSLIKKLDWQAARGLSERFGYIRSSRNLIVDQPDKVVNKLIEEHVQRVIKDRNLMVVNDFLANECICAFIGAFRKLISFDFPDGTIKLKDLQYLIQGKWASAEFEHQYGSFDDAVVNSIYRLQINLDKLQDRLRGAQSFSGGEPAAQRFVAYSQRLRTTSANFDIAYLFKAIQFLMDKGVQYAVDPLQPRDLTSPVRLIWDGYSETRLRQNIEKLVLNFIDTYDSYIQLYFPALFEQMSFTGGYNLVMIILCRLGEDHHNEPYIRVIKFACESDPGINMGIHFFSQNDSPVSMDSYHQDLSFMGRQFQFRSSHGLDHHQFFGKTPLMDTLYDYLKDRFEQYFRALNREITV